MLRETHCSAFRCCFVLLFSQIKQNRRQATEAGPRDRPTQGPSDIKDPTLLEKHFCIASVALHSPTRLLTLYVESLGHQGEQRERERECCIAQSLPICLAEESESAKAHQIK